ncbi:MAG TPA: GntR family transcriptional regulator, partial [Candidatus Acidoferrales bacterium]|nr:GntR family transcriptional regulator [Candidatus Acidoferrales bacterium]
MGASPLYKVIQSSRLYEQIVQQIEDSIFKGELTEGSQLPAERELAEQFGVSRTAVREAIKALQEKGLVDAFPGRGTFVTNGTSNSMRRSLDRIIKTGDRDGSTYL